MGAESEVVEVVDDDRTLCCMVAMMILGLCLINNIVAFLGASTGGNGKRRSERRRSKEVDIIQHLGGGRQRNPKASIDLSPKADERPGWFHAAVKVWQVGI